MEPFMTRGYVILTTLKYCYEGLALERRDKVVARLPPALLQSMPTIKPAEWYPVDRVVQMLNLIVDVCEGDEKLAEQDLIGSGRFAAQEATNTFLRLLMKVLTPNLFAKKLPSLYLRDNSKGKVDVEVADESLVVTISNAKGFAHLPPMTMGWVLFALESMGKVPDTTHVSNWSFSNPDPDEFAVSITWKS